MTSRVPLLTSEHRALLFQDISVSAILQRPPPPAVRQKQSPGANQTCCSLDSHPKPAPIPNGPGGASLLPARGQDSRAGGREVPWPSRRHGGSWRHGCLPARGAASGWLGGDCRGKQRRGRRGRGRQGCISGCQSGCLESSHCGSSCLWCPAPWGRNEGRGERVGLRGAGAPAGGLGTLQSGSLGPLQA